MNGAMGIGPGDGGPPANPLQPLQRRLQVILDKSTPHTLHRWLVYVAVLTVYAVRVYFLHGFYIVTYALGIYNLNLLLGFLTPAVNPELEGPTLPSKSDEEFKPFVRRLPEFKFWWNSFKALLLALLATFFKFTDVPVFWPVLVFYWFILFFVTMKRQIMHMVKYRYVPFSFGKKSYGKNGKAPAKNSK